MCGILALVNLNGTSKTQELRTATELIAHRGPDDEGYLLWDGKNTPNVFAGRNTNTETLAVHELSQLQDDIIWKVGFGHRRLSIIDTSPLGHQPMKLELAGLSITYNGEVYNYLEIKEELVQKGHTFLTHTDTEVILHAWAEWGSNCLHKFNGMFAFVLLDTDKNILYAVRDRFGVKPLYYSVIDQNVIFASEIKQIKSFSGFKSSLNDSIIYDYLAYGLVDHTKETFDQQIHQVSGGEYIQIDLSSSANKINKSIWYTIPEFKFKGSLADASEAFRELFKDSVRLRLRSDVKVGSCLSGGFDSSAIVCQMAELNDQNGISNNIETVTSRYKEAKYDEWQYAKTVIDQTKAMHHTVWPSFDQLTNELDDLLWHMDEPFGSTSQFSQWSVFQGAAKAGLKVMLDGQGADEQLAGYGGNDIALYSGLIRKYKYKQIYNNYNGFTRELGYPPKSQLVQAFANTYPVLKRILPKQQDHQPLWLNDIKNTKNITSIFSLREEMVKQTTVTSLPALLRYEDRNSMAFSIESRVPFLDYRLVELVLSMPEEYIYHLGLRKVLLRQSLKHLLPKEVIERKDKMGFVSPEELWFKDKKNNWFKNELSKLAPELNQFVDEALLSKQLDERHSGYIQFDFLPWRILCFNRWLNLNR